MAEFPRGQIALPLEPAGGGVSRIVIGNANRAVVEALSRPGDWPFGTAVLFGPPRSGKSLLARWFAENAGDAVDDAPLADETELFHRWNRAQEAKTPLLLTAPLAADGPGWTVRLPDLASRLGAALRLEIGVPDEAMLADLIIAQAEARALPLGEEAIAYLVPRLERSHLAVEQLVATIDRLGLERKQGPGPAILRDALEELAKRRDQG